MVRVGVDEGEMGGGRQFLLVVGNKSWCMGVVSHTHHGLGKDGDSW